MQRGGDQKSGSGGREIEEGREVETNAGQDSRSSYSGVEGAGNERNRLTQKGCWGDATFAG